MSRSIVLGSALALAGAAGVGYRLLNPVELTPRAELLRDTEDVWERIVWKQRALQLPVVPRTPFGRDWADDVYSNGQLVDAQYRGLAGEPTASNLEEYRAAQRCLYGSAAAGALGLGILAFGLRRRSAARTGL